MEYTQDVDLALADQIGDPIVTMHQNPDFAFFFLSVEITDLREVAQNLGAFEDT